MVTPGRENDRISAQTVRNRLADYGIRARHPYHGLRLTPPRRRYRAHWAHQHLRWTQNQWNTVLFSDESRFCLGQSVMLWDTISFHEHSELTRARGSLTGYRYYDKILALAVVPFFNANRNVSLF